MESNFMFSKNSVFFIMSMIAILSIKTFAQNNGYNVRLIGLLPSFGLSSAYDISSNGNIAGTAFNDLGLDGHAISWNISNGILDLETFYSSPFLVSESFGVNNAGMDVGNSDIDSSPY